MNTLDFNLLAANFGGAGKAFSQGDFNCDASIDSMDVNMLISQYGKSLSAPVSASSVLLIT